MYTLICRARAIVNKMHSRAFAVAMLAISMSGVMLWLSAATNAVYIRDGEDLLLVYTTKAQPEEILRERGIITMAYDDVDFTGFSRQTVAEISITRAFDVSVTADGSTSQIKVTGGTVGELLRSVGITPDGDDVLSHPAGMFVAPGDDILFQEVSADMRTEMRPITHETIYKGTSLVPKGRTQTLQSGKNGERELTFRQTIVDGELQKEDLINDIITRKPIETVVLKGTGEAVSPLNYGVPLDANGKPTQYKKLLTNQVATGYSAGRGAWGASGLHLFYGSVAVDPTKIPYGSKLYITAADNSFVYGYAIAADTGTGLMNGVIDVDLYYETYLESCLNGRKNVEIYVLN